MKRLLLWGLLISISVPLWGQKAAGVWYFGRNAGVDFTSGTPVSVTDGKLNTEEGCVTICDTSGKLLFYTDGITVWNRAHRIMLNGTGLLGDPSSTSSGVVIKIPETSDKYYLFTVPSTAGTAGFRYSVIDMSLDDGFGGVEAQQKNIFLRGKVTEKLTAVSHRNGKDCWIVVHDWQSDTFASYLIDKGGLKTAPILSKSGLVHKGGSLNTQGYMKSNPDGTNIALALEESDIAQVFDFDNLNGIISNPITINLPPKTYVYGVEFSPDGSLLYLSAAGVGEIYQYNLQNESQDSIAASGIMIGKITIAAWVGALQAAIDGKIYFTIYGKPYLGVITNPNIRGKTCGFMEKGIFLNDKNAQLGLPTFSQNFFYSIEKKKLEYFTGKSIVKGQTFVLNNILFDFNKTTLKPASFVQLDKLVAAMKANPDIKINIIGHTDNVGNKPYNLTLSKNRAKSVADYLISKGVAASRIRYEGMGSSKPVAGNDTEDGKALNRRVEVTFE